MQTANLEQLHAFQLAPPTTNSMTPTLLSCINALFNALQSALYAATVSALVWLFIRLSPGQDVSHIGQGDKL